MCDFESAKNEAYIKIEIKVERLTCDVCDYTCELESTLIEHMKTHAEEPNASNVRDYEYDKIDNLQHCSESHNHELKEPLMCDLCHFKSNHEDIFKNHIKTHATFQNRNSNESTMADNSYYDTDIRSEELACDMCDFKTLHADNFKQHIKTHTGENSSSETCNYEFQHSVEIDMSMHSLDKPYECENEMCDYKCESFSQLKEHSVTHTMNQNAAKAISLLPDTSQQLKPSQAKERPHECHICHTRFTLKSNLKQHLRIHTDIKPYACHICDYKSTKSANLKLHIRIHTGEKPYSCTLCDYRSVNANHLVKHMRTHTGEKPYACGLCDYRCIQRSHLIRHNMSTHTKEKPYSCNMCDYKCVQHTRLKQHIKTHTGEKPFHCNLCEYKCIYVGHLKRHMKVHNKVKAEIL